MVYPVTMKSNVGLSFAYNLNANVGVGMANNLSDVQFCQLGLIFRSAMPVTDPAMKAALMAVQFGPPCTGKPDDPLCAAILAWQRFIQSRGGPPPDGHISRFSGDSVYYGPHDTAHLHLLAALNVYCEDGMGDRWPRLDLIDGCPMALKSEINGYFDTSKPR